MTNESEPAVPGESERAGLPTEIATHLGGIFRHLLPGVLVIAAARLAYPEWFCAVDRELSAIVRNHDFGRSLGIQIGNQPLPAGLSLNI